MLGRSGHVRQGAHMLRERLLLDPHNVAVRRAIAQLYRDGGHHDQAARYEFGVFAADAADQESYLVWLAGTGADEARIRQLSALPDDVAVPDSSLERLEEIRRASVTHEPWETLGWVGAGTFLLVSFVTVLIVYFTVLLGGVFALSVARIGGLVALAALIVCTAGIAGSCGKSGSRRGTIGWSVITVLLTGLWVLGAVGLLRG